MLQREEQPMLRHEAYGIGRQRQEKFDTFLDFLLKNFLYPRNGSPKGLRFPGVFDLATGVVNNASAHVCAYH